MHLKTWYSYSGFKNQQLSLLRNRNLYFEQHLLHFRRSVENASECHQLTTGEPVITLHKLGLPLRTTAIQIHRGRGIDAGKSMYMPKATGSHQNVQTGVFNCWLFETLYSLLMTSEAGCLQEHLNQYPP